MKTFMRDKWRTIPTLYHVFNSDLLNYQVLYHYIMVWLSSIEQPAGHLPRLSHCPPLCFSCSVSASHTGVSCGMHSTVNSSTQSSSMILNYQDSISVVCDVGHELIETDGSVNVTRVCQANGKFSGSLPVCLPVECPDYGQPVNGQRSTDVHTYKTVQKFTCNHGYNMTGGSKSIECLANKSWTGSVPVCSSE